MTTSRPSFDLRPSERVGDVLEGDLGPAAVIESNSISADLTPLAEALVGKQRGTLAKIVPTTAFASTSGREERRFLASRFHIDMVVTSHDPKRPNFSENTDIHESLLICRRREWMSRPTTAFIALNRMPRSPEEVAQWVDAAIQRVPHPCHQIHIWPPERINAGDWSPALYYDGFLAAHNDELETMDEISPASDLIITPVIDPGIVRGAVRNPLKTPPSEDGNGHPVVWRHQADRRRTMRGEVEFHVAPKPDRRGYVESRILPKTSCLLVTLAASTTTIRTTAQILPEPCFGSAWTAFRPNDRIARPDEAMQAWCAYLNSTLGVLSYLHRRARKLTYGRYRPAQLHTIPLPDPAKCDLAPLADAFRELQDAELLPWPKMNECPVRAKLDAAAAACLDIDIDSIAWTRRLIAAEPTVSNRSAYTGRNESAVIDFFFCDLDQGVSLARDRFSPRELERLTDFEP